MGLHDVNVKMAIMDKLMSFFMICYLVMWLWVEESSVWFTRCCFLLVAFSGIGGGGFMLKSTVFYWGIKGDNTA